MTGSWVALSGVPLKPPSKWALRALLTPKVSPSGSTPSSSKLSTSPRPVIFGRNASIVLLTIKSRCWLSYENSNGRSKMSSIASHIPSPSWSGNALTTLGSVPQSNSVWSSIKSLSSSSSSVSPVVESPFSSSGIPSPSVSSEAAGSVGNASGPATQILASGVAGPSQTPSPSESGFAGSDNESTSFKKSPVLVSSSLRIPSPSISSSSESQIPSPSMSAGVSSTSNGSD